MGNSSNIITLKNGVTLIALQMPGVQSAAFNIKIPCGSAYIDKKHAGAGAIINDLLFRGTQNLTSKELVGKMESIGLHRSSECSTAHINMSGVLEASNLMAALDIYSEIILKSGFASDQFTLSQETAIQELAALDDEPRQKVMLKLKEQFYPEPFNHNAMGTEETLKSLNCETVAKIYNENLDLSGLTISVAGDFNIDELEKKVSQLFSASNNISKPSLNPEQKVKCQYHHIPHEGSQLHIGFITPTVTISDPDYYNILAASTILGGGMSSRLFTEVREKRGLCYSVGAKYQTMKDVAGIACYAGTTPEKSQETVDVVINELTNLKNGITQDELDRAKVGMKSSLIMSSESSSARASNIGSDFYLLGKVRSLDEIKSKIENLTLDSVLGFLNSKPIEDFAICTIGANPINLPKNK